MGLSAHELILVLRARDEASRVLRHFNDGMRQIDRETQRRAQQQFARGSALATGGVAVAAAGALGVAALNDMTNSAMNYNEQAAKTMTQVDGIKISLQELKDMGIEVGRTMPVAFEQVQDSLYDIFSSIDVNVPEAKTLLRGIGQAAVGGKVDMETAGRGIIQILNAWQMNVKKTGHVNDVMFQLVRKGVGTYEEFTKALGRAVPSARKAGQEVEDLAGVMAFLTRNGLSTNMAATSAARAFDAMANPKTVEKFKEIGVNIADSTGKFRPMAEVAADLRDKLSGLSEEARAAELQNLFKGSGGTIQAMRFFNLAVKDGSGLLQNLTGDMHNAGGAAKQAYDIMANTPQAKLQMLNNQYEIMKTKIGDQLLPIKLKLAEALSKILDWFNRLSPETQKWIARIMALSAALAIIVGIVMAVVGGFLMFGAAAALAGVSVGTLALAVGGVLVAIAALVAAGVAIYKNWDTIKAKGIAIWNAIVSKLSDVWYGFVNLRQKIVDFAKEVWSVVGPTLMRAWDDIKAGVADLITTIQPYWDKFTAVLQKVWTHAREFAVGVGGFLGRVFDIMKPVLYAVAAAFSVIASVVGGVLRAAFEMIGGILGNLLQILTNVIDFVYNIFTGHWSEAWQNILEIGKGAVGAIVSVIVGLGKMVGSIIYNLVRSVIDFFKNLWDVLVGHSIIPDMVKSIINWIMSMHNKVILWIRELIFKVIAFFASLPGKVISAIASLASSLYNKAKEWLDSMKAGIEFGWSAVKSFVSDIPSKIISALGSLGSLLYNAGSNILQGLLDGLRSKWEDVKGFVSGIGSWIADHKGPRSYDLKLLKPAGRWILEGFERSLNANIYRVHRAIGNVNNALQPDMMTARAVGYAAGNSSATGAGAGTTIHQEITVNTQEINPVKHAADLGWELAKRGGF